MLHSCRDQSYRQKFSSVEGNSRSTNIFRCLPGFGARSVPDAGTRSPAPARLSAGRRRRAENIGSAELPVVSPAWLEVFEPVGQFVGVASRCCP